jgi:sarcosine oxidase
VTVNPDELDPRVATSEENTIRDFIAQNLPTGIGPTLRLTVCMTTRASDEEFILDAHPEYSNVHVVGGFTGMGFMTSSALGEVVAELALDGDTNQDISRFSLNRF